MAHKLFDRQLAKARRENGEVDLVTLGELVASAYEEADRDRQRTDRSIALMIEELGDIHQRLVDAFEVIPEGIALFDADDRYVMWNSRYAEIYKASGNAIAVGNSFEGTLRAGLALGQYADAVGNEEAWLAARLARHREPSSTHEQHLAGDRWVRIEERRTANGGSVGVRVDITELKKREESFRLLFDSNPMPMWVVDLDSNKYLALNDAAVELYGYSRDRFLAMTMFDIRPPEDLAKFKQYIRKGDISQGTRIWRHQKADGTLIHVAVYGRSMPYNGHRARIAAVVDVTERVAAETKLREQKLQIDTAINNMTQGLLMFDAKSRLVLCNPRYIEMYNLSAEVAKPGCGLRELIMHRQRVGCFSGDPEKYCDELLACVAQGKSSNQVVELPDGRFIRVINRPMSDGGWVATHEDITDRRRAQRRIENLQYLAHHDPLTGLPNRAAFDERLSKMFASAERDVTKFAVICLDLDRFKEVNDVFGHAVGDALLVEIGERMEIALGGEFLARLGGDEFSMIIAGGVQPVALEDLTARMQAAAAEELIVDGHSIRSGVSIGVAIYPSDGSTAETLLANADAALYRAKREGRGSVRFFEAEMDRQARERREMQNDLYSAVEHGELQLYYQPQSRVDREVVGFEALMRWQHPTRGLILPDVFGPLAEESGLIIKMGEWFLHKACREAASWSAPLQVAVNLSSAQFQHGDLPNLIHGVLLESGLAPERLEVEITESVLIGDFSRAVSILHRVKNLGVRVVMDNFGTGYSSLSYLQAFPFDKIKIDRTFISNLEQNPQSAAIVRAVIGLARGLSLPVTAEGVETGEQLDFLARESCDEVQGFLIGKPLPIENYADLVGKPAVVKIDRAVATR
jgi:diguanylate cyclase (GGDEF)-like protein/PAS domain S-box-containing protein